tara:strand:- start:4309 stop:5256 length:948 start_codon:yes stop_codon:yes gene_type:complete
MNTWLSLKEEIMKINKIFQKPFNALTWAADSGHKCSKKYISTYARAIKEWTDKGKLSMVTLEQPFDEVLEALEKTKDFTDYSFKEKMACLPNERSVFSTRMKRFDGDSATIMHYLFTKCEDEDGYYIDVGLLIERPTHVTVSQYQGLVYDFIDSPKEDKQFRIQCGIRLDPAEYDELEGNNKPCINIDNWQEHPDADNIYKWTCMIGTALSIFTYLMGHSKLEEFSQDVIPPIKIIKNAIRKDKIPPIRYKVLNLSMFKRQGIKTGLKFPDRMKPAEHTRRAHIRRLNGIIIPVRSSVINKNIGRRIIKDYNLID